jgi:hypothetical protein
MHLADVCVTGAAASAAIAVERGTFSRQEWDLKCIVVSAVNASCCRVCVTGAAASAAIAIERGTFSKQEWEEQLGPDPAKLDNTVKYDMQMSPSCSH